MLLQRKIVKKVGWGGEWQKCVEDNAGVIVDELKHSGGR